MEKEADRQEGSRQEEFPREGFPQGEFHQGDVRQEDFHRGIQQEALEREIDREFSEELRREEDVVESLLFMMGRSVSVEEMAVALDTGAEPARAAAERLLARYQRQQGGILVQRLEDRYQMHTNPQYFDAMIRLVKKPKKPELTDVLVETLAIIAYRQPVTKAEIERIRGVKSDHAVNRLVEYELVQEAGRLNAPGRPVLFATTEAFLRHFGISSLRDLPSLQPDIQEVLASEVEAEIAEILGLPEGGEGEGTGEAADPGGGNPGAEATTEGTEAEVTDAGDTGTETSDTENAGAEAIGVGDTGAKAADAGGHEPSAVDPENAGAEAIDEDAAGAEQIDEEQPTGLNAMDPNADGAGNIADGSADPNTTDLERKDLDAAVSDGSDLDAVDLGDEVAAIVERSTVDSNAGGAEDIGAEIAVPDAVVPEGSDLVIAVSGGDGSDVADPDGDAAAITGRGAVASEHDDMGTAGQEEAFRKKVDAPDGAEPGGASAAGATEDSRERGCSVPGYGEG